MVLIMRKIKFVFLFLALLFAIPLVPQLFHKNVGESISVGSVSNGSLKNSYLLERKEDNYRYYSFLSPYVLGRANGNEHFTFPLYVAYKQNINHIFVLNF